VTPESRRVDFVIDVDGEVAGSVAFINIDGHKAQVSTWVAPAYWRRGLAANALRQLVEFGFETMGLVRIYAYHYTENLKTAGLLEKAGFRFEDVHEKEWMKEIDGEIRFFDSNYYSIVKDHKQVRSVVLSMAHGDGYEHVQAVAQRLESLLTTEGIAVHHDSDDFKTRVDLAIALGGDGTMMHTVSKFSSRSIPTLGINAGGVGFLTSAESGELEKAVRRIVERDYMLERRTSLRFLWKGDHYGPFANEVSLLHPTRGIATVEVQVVGEELFERLSGDGILVATATGSTAYNASVGGPIMTPEVRAVVVNAISPPMFNMRPVVTEKLSAGGAIELRVVESKHDQPLTIAADSLQLTDGPRVGESILISKHPQPLLFATFGNKQYTEALKGKMHLVR